MERGKKICNALKEIRKRIADANGIPYESEECRHEGDCLGTYPKCEDEFYSVNTRLFHLKFKSVHNALTRFRPSRVIFYVVYVSCLALV